MRELIVELKLGVPNNDCAIELIRHIQRLVNGDTSSEVISGLQKILEDNTSIISAAYRTRREGD